MILMFARLMRGLMLLDKPFRLSSVPLIEHARLPQRIPVLRPKPTGDWSPRESPFRRLALLARRSR
jgi:hypothetical protein